MKITFELVAGLTISLIVLLLLFLFIFTSKTGIREISDSQICKQSLKMNAYVRYDKLSGYEDIKCPTLFIEINEKNTNNKKVVFETLALALADTWNEFLEGKEELFATETQDYCVVRRVVEFDDSVVHKGFFDYLLQHNPPSVRKPYFSYLTDIDVTKDIISATSNMELKNADIIDTSTPYAAVFLLSKKENIGKLLGAQIGAETGGVIGLATGTTITYLSAGIGVIPALKIVSAGVAAGTTIGGSIGFLLGSSYPADWNSAIILIPYTQENLNSLDCTKLPVSVVQTTKAAG